MSIVGPSTTSQNITEDTGNPHTIKLLNSIDTDAGTDEAIENVVADFDALDDDITGNDLDNILLGHKGNDKIHGEGGDDHIEGGDGDDSELYGGDGDDTINGGPGIDVLHGNAGDDIVQGDGFGSRIVDENIFLKDQSGSVILNEVSGLVVSRANTDILFSIEDGVGESGGPIFLYANDKTTGDERGYYTIGTSGQPDASNVDWEDLAFYHDRSTETDYIYIADIGDNDEERDYIVIYRVEEPTVPDDSSSGLREDLSYEVLKLEYPDGPRDSEVLMVEPAGDDYGTIYIVSKSEPEEGRLLARLYSVDRDAQEWETDLGEATVIELEDLGETNFRANTRNDSPSGGDISPIGGREVVLKSDNEIHVYSIDRQSPIRSIESMLVDNRPTQIIDIRDSDNRESIAYDTDGDGLFTVSEENDEENRFIHFYERVSRDDLTITANVDTIYGGDPTNTSNGQDIYIGERDGAGNDEVKDFSTSRSTDLDLVVGLLGDVDFDGSVDFDDIDDFVAALQSLSDYFDDWGLGAWVNGDIDEDGDVDYDDIDLFIALLS